MAHKPAGCFTFSVLVFTLLCALPLSRAQSMKVPFAALSPTYAPLWIAEQAGYFQEIRIRGSASLHFRRVGDRPGAVIRASGDCQYEFSAGAHGLGARR